MTTVTRTVGFGVKGRRRKLESEEQAGCVTRISKLMALAIRYDQMLNDGVVQSQTELAELLHVTQPRMTQIMNLLHLAPRIQEEILHLDEDILGSRRLIHERGIRQVAQMMCWEMQMGEWNTIRSYTGSALVVSRQNTL